MNKTGFSLLGMALAVTLAGCETMSEPEPLALAPDFGNAVKTNMAAQVVNPEAGLDDRAPPPLDGQKAENAMDAYRKEKGKASAERLLIDIGSGTSSR